jgi:hypothetical protein
VPPLPQGLLDLLHLLAESLGARLAPARTLAWPRLARYGRPAENVAGLRVALATPLAPCAGPAPNRKAARLVRGQCQGDPVEAFPPVAPKLLGIVFVLQADTTIGTVPPDEDVSPGVPAAPRRRPEGTDSVQGAGCQERTGAPPWGRPCRLLSPLPLRPPALSHWRM